MPNTITATPSAIPIVLTGKNNAERMKEIINKLEQGTPSSRQEGS